MAGSSESAAVDHDVLEDITDRLATTDRFRYIETEPEDNSDSIRCSFDTDYYPPDLRDAYLDITWYKNGDFTIHYQELYTDGDEWKCRWDRHPNDHNTREHFHPGPDAARDAAQNDSYPTDWRDVLERVIDETDERMRGFWS